MNTLNNQSTTIPKNSSPMPMISDRTTFVAIPTSSTIQPSQILLINNVESQPVSGILLPPNHFMLKLNQKQIKPELEQDDDYAFSLKYFSMNNEEQKIFCKTFFSTLLNFVHQILKDNHVVSCTDSVWEHIASKLDNIIKPKTIYNRFILDVDFCKTKLIEAYFKDSKNQNINISELKNMKKTIISHDTVEKRPGYIDSETFYNALFAFKEKIFKDEKVASGIDSVWNQISAHLNHALKPKSVYIRFKRNADNCFKKLLDHYQLDPSKAKTYDISNNKCGKSVEKPMNKIKKKNLKFNDSIKFFEALYAHRCKIIKNGLIARHNNSVWKEVAKTLDYALQPSDVYSKFSRNHDLCQTRLIEVCKNDKNFIPLVVPKFNSSSSVSDDDFFNVLCKYRNDILQNGNKLARFSHPIWTRISKELNDTLKPATIYFKVMRNSQLCLNRLLKPKDCIYKDTFDKNKFIETICLYKYSIMNGDQVVDLNDPVWNEISIRLNSSLSPEAIYDAISQDKDLCKTKMVQALKTESSVFSGENLKISENINEPTPIVECNVSNEPVDNFNEVLNEFKTSIIQPNGQIVLKDNPVWKQISHCLKNVESDDVYSRFVNDYKNCRTQLCGDSPVDKNKFFKAIFKYRRLLIDDNVVANINNKVWTKINKELNFALTQKEIYIRFIKDVDGCRTELSKRKRKNLNYIQTFDKDTFLDIVIGHKDAILKSGSYAKPNDPVWREIASKLNFVLQPLAVYNNFKINRHNCKQRVLEASKIEKKEMNKPLISSNITPQADYNYLKDDTETNLKNIISTNKKDASYVYENDFLKACSMFRDRLIKNNRIVSSSDGVWNAISRRLNYAVEAKSLYLRFKQNTYKCQEKLFGRLINCKGDKKGSFSAEDYIIENKMFFDTLLIFKNAIINNGVYATKSSPVWIDVSNLMNNLLTPVEAFCKFRQNVNLCRTNLIKKCVTEWNDEPPSVIKHRINLIKSKESLWVGTLTAKELEKLDEKSNIKSQCTDYVDDDEFYDIVYKYKSRIFYNDLVVDCIDPVWTDIAKDLNYVLEPSTIHSKFKNNMGKCSLKFLEAAQRYSLYKLNEKQNQIINRHQPLLIDENSNESCNEKMVIDCENEQIVEPNLEELKFEDCKYDYETKII